jgi:hypothetical protein
MTRSTGSRRGSAPTRTGPIRWAGGRGFITNPRQISVRGNFGGSASAVLKS